MEKRVRLTGNEIRDLGPRVKLQEQPPGLEWIEESICALGVEGSVRLGMEGGGAPARIKRGGMWWHCWWVVGLT